MRYAILTDIHGNSIGLDAVLADIHANGGVDSYILLGDYSVGYDPVGVAERLAALPTSIRIRGNGEDHIVQPLVPDNINVTISFSWTRGCITQAGWYDWLTTLPLEQRLTLPDGTHLLAVHAAPGSNNNPGLMPSQTDDEVATLFSPASESLILVGHTHVPQERRVDGKHIVNVGSVGNPVGADTRACYGILDATADGYTLSLHRVAYEVNSVLRAIDAVHYPAPDRVRTFYRGEYFPTW